MDLETLLTMIYVIVEEWYEAKIAPQKSRRGRPAQFSDSEALTIAVVGAWGKGVPWDSERGLIRYMHSHYKAMFPHLPQRSAFNERVRRLYGVLVELQQELSERLREVQVLYECVDCLPIPAGSGGQYSRARRHWLMDSTIGRGSGQWFWGDHLLVAVQSNGAVTGWLVGAAHLNDRWLLEAFVSTRAGTTCLMGPPRPPHRSHAEYAKPPIGFIGGWAAVGRATGLPYLADRGFNGPRWAEHWQTHYQATVFTIPPDNMSSPAWTPAEKHWLNHHRQVVETTFAILTEVFHLKRLRAHSRWGQLTRIAAKIAAFNLGLWLNHLLGRPPFAFATLLC
ncbi:MAG: hypothetical protein DPW16_09935 [Chloroflexi bacterium]|nr:hypothetical protein [Chloroflexota bacterium]